MRSFIVIGLLILLQMMASAQRSDYGKVIVFQDPLVDTLLQQYEILTTKNNGKP